MSWFKKCNHKCEHVVYSEHMEEVNLLIKYDHEVTISYKGHCVRCKAYVIMEEIIYNPNLAKAILTERDRLYKHFETKQTNPMENVPPVRET